MGGARFSVLHAAILSCLLLGGAATAFSAAPEYYEKKGTWFESIVASVQAGGKKVNVRQVVAALKADFPDVEDIRQLMLETHAGIWDPRRPQADPVSLFQSYLACCKGDVPETLTNLKPETIADVAKARNEF